MTCLRSTVSQCVGRTKRNLATARLRGFELNGINIPIPSATVIVAHTIKGKGISFSENVVSFHNGTLSQEQFDQALAELV